MEYRLLGPLEVRDDGRSIPLAGAKQRALLALLLIHANRVISRERLIDELWGDRPPDTAVQSVQVYISRLRKLLGTERIETRPPGYVLHVGADELDADRFENLLSSARAAPEPASRAALTRRALETFSGDPLADFEEEAFAQAEIWRLAQLRLAALEERIDADLELGRAAEVVVELETLVTAEPQRERLQELLILSLYRAGRQADALAAYRSARAAMVEELGLEPSPRLQSLERAILAQDPALDPERRRLPLPRQRVPAPAHPLIGRGSDLESVETLLVNGARLVTITGVGGCGKTRFALELARTLAGRFDHTVFVALAPLAAPELVASTVAGVLELAGPSGQPIADAIAAHIGDVPLLLVLDNAEHVIDGTAFLAQLLESCPRLALLVTSRGPLHLKAEHEYLLDPLPPEDAAELFRVRAEAVDPRFVAEKETMAAICERLDHLPLALELAAVQVRVLSPLDLLARLDDRLGLLTSGPRDAPDRQRTLRSAIDWSYALLPGDARLLFAGLAVFAGGCTYEAAHAACGASLELLGTLVDASLLRRRSVGGVARFWMLETIRAYALEQLAESNADSAIRRRHAAYFVTLAERAAAELAGPEQRRALDGLDADLDNLRGALAWSQSEEPGWALRLAAALGRFWAIRGLFREARAWLDSVAASAGVDPAAGARALLAGGNIARYEGDRTDARVFFERGLELVRAVGPEDYIAKFLTSLGQLERLDGDATRARAHFEEALAVCAATDIACRAVTTASLALISIDDGDHETAADLLTSSVAAFGAIGDQARLCGVMASLAYVQHERGKAGEARSSLREALRLAADFDDPSVAAFALMVAACAEGARAPDKATRWLGSAERAYKSLGRELEPLDRRVREQALAMLPRSHDGLDATEARHAGARLTLSEAVADTLVLLDAPIADSY